ncbi:MULTISPECIES: U32 family peptidase [unclassified Cupriavidus]|uniref:U32 family peptidase n=1 Tax=unclassified Cupriavidus TaxID=2640874 RepID=UPI001C005BDC|nr:MULTISPECIES: U32 family peptidase [unclassified Cupriavidus]MCA3187038.1 U32 family peptidase [Cupriavidus sp.]MCA3188740.1 U32 family peptidase [Cupriavidus sp.]MCA3199756.1 U32 family peptidase [Cupriavidus sp.]MCA3205230.1 U32 family peptidase [Cupriavidus sp.]MCA3210350.1 U32 family peptidase [Cupriavidus sp.]
MATITPPIPEPFRIALGPLLYYWPRTAVLEFYASVAGTAVERVYLGEAVCTRRHEMRLADWIEVAQMLRDAGKQVVLSTPVLVESDSDIAVMRRVCAQEEFLVEANDLGAVHGMRGRPFVGGPHLNVYHADTLAWLASLGAQGCVVPVEMDGSTMTALAAARPAGLALEAMVWGRMPLAFSARCFTARHHRLRKDACEFRCLEYPDGLVAKTGEGQDFFTLNGIQTQSATCLDLCAQVSQMAAAGIGYARISPHATGTLEAIAHLDAIRRGERAASPSAVMPAGAAPSNGYWGGKPGIHWLSQDGVAA